MSSNKKLELVNLAIQENKTDDGSGQILVEDDDDQLILSRLLSQQIESLEGDDVRKKSEASTEPTAPAVEEPTVSQKAGLVDGCDAKICTEEIIKELKKVKRQNAITHWLLSAMIVLTVAWQLSEVSLILKVKDGLNHPFKSFGSMLAGMLQGPGTKQQDAEIQSSSTKENHIEAPSFLVQMPELPHLQLPDTVEYH
ncbi:hypothetical protein CFOL_v3_17003 [Cephalotus follicularis]|uniref:Uncharacterized protein n=1 Tax=Cephalotus follicularis TaxID=3775 RepID=A0A1Q3C064_CEPFO|nr:hypothetical protein CFOL_v3_17003 [Cephalotus follicularis]